MTSEDFIPRVSSKLKPTQAVVPYKATVGSWQYHADNIPNIIQVGFGKQEGVVRNNGWELNAYAEHRFQGQWWGNAATKNEMIVYGVNEDPSGGADGVLLISFFANNREMLQQFLNENEFETAVIEEECSIIRFW